LSRFQQDFKATILQGSFDNGNALAAEGFIRGDRLYISLLGVPED